MCYLCCIQAFLKHRARPRCCSILREELVKKQGCFLLQSQNCRPSMIMMFKLNHPFSKHVCRIKFRIYFYRCSCIVILQPREHGPFSFNYYMYVRIIGPCRFSLSDNYRSSGKVRCTSYIHLRLLRQNYKTRTTVHGHGKPVNTR